MVDPTFARSISMRASGRPGLLIFNTAPASRRCFAHQNRRFCQRSDQLRFHPRIRGTMTTDAYEKLPAVDRKRFMECPECREILCLEELLLHLAYKHSGFQLGKA